MQKAKRNLYLVLNASRAVAMCTIVGLGACKSGGSQNDSEGDPPQSSAPVSVERQLNATSTDPGITAAPATGESPHVAINPSNTVPQRGKLFVFLPGTKGQPTQYAQILRAAAIRGFHAIGINYPNQTAMGALCQTSSDPDCYWKARNVVVFGGDTPVPGQAVVTVADSIVNRLKKALVSLQSQFPDEGWSQYLAADGNVAWNNVVLAGHSQGGGHAGILAKTVALSRAVYFSSPEDWNETSDTPATWTRTRPNVTSPDLQFGFGADADTLVPNAHAFAHWDSIGLSKPADGPVSVDAGGTFSGSHQLRTASSFNPASTALTVGLKRHGITVVDTSTPIDSTGQPVFDANGTWQYLCFQ